MIWKGVYRQSHPSMN